MVERLAGAERYRVASERVPRWAADPAVDGPLLRQALDEVLAINAMTPPLSQALKRDYLILTRDLDEMRILVDEIPPPLVTREWLVRRPLLFRGVRAYQRGRVAVRQDRERSRRLFQLLFANWLAQVDKPPEQRVGIAVTHPQMIYEPDPTAPAAARVIGPRNGSPARLRTRCWRSRRSNTAASMDRSGSSTVHSPRKAARWRRWRRLWPSNGTDDEPRDVLEDHFDHE